MRHHLQVFSLPALKDFIIEGIELGTTHTAFPGTPEEQAEAIQFMFLVMAICFLVWTVVDAVGAIVTFKARKENSQALYVASIVFGILGATEVAAVGGVFGLVSGGEQAESVVEEETTL